MRYGPTRISNCNPGDAACCAVLTKLQAKMKDRVVINQRKTIVKSKTRTSIADLPTVPTRSPRGIYVFCWPING